MGRKYQRQLSECRWTDRIERAILRLAEGGAGSAKKRNSPDNIVMGKIGLSFNTCAHSLSKTSKGEIKCHRESGNYFRKKRRERGAEAKFPRLEQDQTETVLRARSGDRGELEASSTNQNTPRREK